MELEKLKECVDKGFSIADLSKEFNKGKTTIRYWLRNFNLKTNNKTKRQFENKNCVVCEKLLVGNQLKFCSNNCKSKFSYNNSNSSDRQNKKGVQRKLFLINLMGGKCQMCGYSKNIGAFDFHHEKREDKVFNLDSRTLSNRTMDSIILESKKCILLCSNCHREYHNPELDMSILKEIQFKENNFLLTSKQIKEKRKNYCFCGNKIDRKAKICRNCYNKKIVAPSGLEPETT